MYEQSLPNQEKMHCPEITTFIFPSINASENVWFAATSILPEILFQQNYTILQLKRANHNFGYNLKKFKLKSVNCLLAFLVNSVGVILQVALEIQGKGELMINQKAK